MECASHRIQVRQRRFRAVESSNFALSARAKPRRVRRLLDRDGRRQVARLLDVGAARDGDVVREKLQRHAVDDGRDALRKADTHFLSEQTNQSSRRNGVAKEGLNKSLRERDMDESARDAAIGRC